ncbi:13321_t:CDS:1, partial [Dentiscutata erythropus]
MNQANINGGEHQNDQNAEFIKNIIEGIDPFTTAQYTGAPQQTPPLPEIVFLGSS